jgi:dTDP-4-amino-4,6-dideoxygalactose transaminase
MKVPLLDLKLQYQAIKEEINEALLKVAESQIMIFGPEVAKLEESLAEYCGTKHAIVCSSGTDALLMALMALDIKPEDEVILPTYSFFATAGVVARLNARPVFVDSKKETFNIDPDEIRKAITSKARAIIPVHLYGQCADMDEINEIGREFNLPVIEDAAQAIGSQYKDGRRAGSMGLMGCFSFYPTKNLGGFGEGGFVSTNDDDMAIKLKQMRNHGMEPKYYHKFVGGNFRLDAIQAAVLNVKLPHLPAWHAKRRENADMYNKYFIAAGLAESTGVQQYDENNKVLLPKAVYAETGHEDTHIYNQYIVRSRKRDDLRAFLMENEIGSEIYYPVPFHRQECFASLNYRDDEFPNANTFAAESIALPIFPELTEDQIKYVVDKFAEFLK